MSTRCTAISQPEPHCPTFRYAKRTVDGNRPRGSPNFKRGGAGCAEFRRTGTAQIVKRRACYRPPYFITRGVKGLFGSSIIRSKRRRCGGGIKSKFSRFIYCRVCGKRNQKRIAYLRASGEKRTNRGRGCLKKVSEKAS